MATDETADAGALSIDELAAATGTTTRSIRSFQTLGLLDHPDLRGRTGLYGGHHRHRLEVILRLQSAGFSLRSLAVLFAAHGRGESLGDVLGLGESDPEIHPDLEAGAGRVRVRVPTMPNGTDSASCKKAAPAGGYGGCWPLSRRRSGTRRRRPDRMRLTSVRARGPRTRSVAAPLARGRRAGRGGCRDQPARRAVGEPLCVAEPGTPRGRCAGTGHRQSGSGPRRAFGVDPASWSSPTKCTAPGSLWSARRIGAGGCTAWTRRLPPPTSWSRPRRPPSWSSSSPTAPRSR